MLNLQNFLSTSPAADRVIVSEDAAGDPVLKESKYSLLDKTVLFFSKIPLLKNTSLVKNYVEKLHSPNKDAIGLFLNALAKRYGVKGASAAAEALGAATPPLDARKIKQLSSIAESYYGKGEAKTLSRQVAVRIWPHESMDRVGHASITVKNRTHPNSNKQVNEHISWWPGKSPSGGKWNQFFGKRPGASLSSYQEDKRHEISDRTAARLAEGELAREELKKGNSSPELLQKARYLPRANQKKGKDGVWGVVAQKVYLPMVGNNKDMVTGKKTFSLFGLNEKLILADAKKAKDDAEKGIIGYTLASKTENCAGMAARMLKSGGAENFVEFKAAWISEDPNKVHDYALAVQNEVDVLNKKAGNIDKHFSDRTKDPSFKAEAVALKQVSITPFNNELNELKKQAQETKNPQVRANLNLQIKLILEKQISAIALYFKGDVSKKTGADTADSALRKKILDNAPGSKDSFNDLIRKAKAMVTAMDSSLQKDADYSKNPEMKTLVLAHAMLEKIRDFMKIEA